MPDAAPASPFSAADDGLRIAVRLTPGSSADRIDGRRILDDAQAVLAARVRAIAEDGQANRALTKLVAKSLRVPAGTVAVVAGHRSRRKTVFVAGDGTSLLDSALALWPQSSSS